MSTNPVTKQETAVEEINENTDLTVNDDDLVKTQDKRGELFKRLTPDLLLTEEGKERIAARFTPYFKQLGILGNYKEMCKIAVICNDYEKNAEVRARRKAIQRVLETVPREELLSALQGGTDGSKQV